MKGVRYLKIYERSSLEFTFKVIGTAWVALAGDYLPVGNLILLSLRAVPIGTKLSRYVPRHRKARPS